MEDGIVLLSRMIRKHNFLQSINAIGESITFTLGMSSRVIYNNKHESLNFLDITVIWRQEYECASVLQQFTSRTRHKEHLTEKRIVLVKNEEF